jgi:4-azaleucine resistance transporter AzlC
MRTIWRTPWKEAITIGVSAGAIGLSFGVLAVASGLSPWMAQAMSLLVFAGGSQFLALAITAAGGGAVAAVGAGILLNARHLPYGLALAPLLGGGRLRRAAAGQIVIDESTAMALAQPTPREGERAFWAVGGILFVLWNAGTALGALAGGRLGDPETFGLDAAFPASILALLAPQLRAREGRAAAAAGAALALAATPFTRPGVPVLVACLGVALGLVVARRAAPEAEEA